MCLSWLTLNGLDLKNLDLTEKSVLCWELDTILNVSYEPLLAGLADVAGELFYLLAGMVGYDGKVDTCEGRLVSSAPAMGTLVKRLTTLKFIIWPFFVTDVSWTCFTESVEFLMNELVFPVSGLRGMPSL